MPSFFRCCDQLSDSYKNKKSIVGISIELNAIKESLSVLDAQLLAPNIIYGETEIRESTSPKLPKTLSSSWSLDEEPKRVENKGTESPSPTLPKNSSSSWNRDEELNQVENRMTVSPSPTLRKILSRSWSPDGKMIRVEYKLTESSSPSLSITSSSRWNPVEEENRNISNLKFSDTCVELKNRLQLAMNSLNDSIKNINEYSTTAKKELETTKLTLSECLSLLGKIEAKYLPAYAIAEATIKNCP